MGVEWAGGPNEAKKQPIENLSDMFPDAIEMNELTPAVTGAQKSADGNDMSTSELLDLMAKMPRPRRPIRKSNRFE